MSSKNKKNKQTGADKASNLDIRLDAKLGGIRHEPEFIPLPVDEFVMPVPEIESEQEPVSAEPRDTDIYETEQGGAKPDETAMLIPEESEDPADKALAKMADDSVRSYYSFVNLAILVIASLGIALTFLFIREGDLYSVDNIQLSAETFFDGSYTASLSNRYINEMKLDTVITRLANVTRYAYGFGSDISFRPVIPDSQGTTDDEPYITKTTTTWNSDETTTSSVSQSVAASVNGSFTGTPVTMPSLTLDVEPDFTGALNRTTTSLTTSLTTTAPYSYTATASAAPPASVTAATSAEPSQTETNSDVTEDPISSETDASPTETDEPDQTPTVTEPPEASPEE